MDTGSPSAAHLRLQWASTETSKGCVLRAEPVVLTHDSSPQTGLDSGEGHKNVRAHLILCGLFLT